MWKNTSKTKSSKKRKGGHKKGMAPNAVIGALRSPKTPPGLKAGLAKKYPKLAKEAGYKA